MEIIKKLLFLSFFVFCGNLYSQEILAVSGKVTESESGMPIPGANVIEKGTSNGVVTNFDGEYTIQVSSDGVLKVSYLGYATMEVEVNRQTQIGFSLVPQANQLEEIVLVGYGTQTKKTVTGSISSVDGGELSEAPIASTSNTLAGRLPGLISKQSSGMPGSDAAQLSIRGFGNPLVIVDGVQSDINTIDPNQIETVSILKDGAAAIYGSRAGNGVILVTTKRGKIGKPTITFNTSQSWQGITAFPKPVNAGQYAELESEEWLQSGQDPDLVPWTEEEIQKFYDGSDPLYPSTNWYDELIRTWTPQQQHNLSVRGGGENVRFYTFFGYLDQGTVWKLNTGGYERYNFQTNIDADILDNLSMQLTLSSIVEDREFPVRNQGQGGDGTVWTDFWQTRPIYHPHFPDPSKIPYAQGGGTGGAHITSNDELSGYNNNDRQDIRGSLALNYDFDPIDGLSARAFVDYRKGYEMNKNFRKPVDFWSYDPASETYTQVGSYMSEAALSIDNSQELTLTGQFSISYNNTFAEDHRVDALVLYEVIDYSDQWTSAGREGFLSSEIDQLFAGSSDGMSNDGAATEMGRSSYVGRLNYSFKNKYLFESTIRADASAKFPADTRWGYFPSISVGWRLSEENFMENILNPGDNLKLRASYGMSGNDAVGNFQYLAGYSFGRSVILGSGPQIGLVSRGLANPNLTWEEVTIKNIGFDLSLYNGKLYSEADVFYRDRSGIPATRGMSLPNTFGADLPPENINSLNNKGFEFLLGSAGSMGALIWDVNGNISYSRAKWDHYEEPDYTDPDQIRINQNSGRWTNTTFGYRSNGLFTSQEEINALSFDQDQQGNVTLRPGDIRYVDINGDGELNWRDQVQIGKGTTPNWMFGFTTNMRFKNFDFSALIQGAWGYQNYVQLNTGSVPFDVLYKERWTQENNDPDALVPRLGGASSNSLTSDHFLKDAGYVRLKTLSIGYSLPIEWLDAINLTKVRVYAAGTNLITLDKLMKYGTDPEAPSAHTGRYYPQQRTVSLGANISL